MVSQIKVDQELLYVPNHGRNAPCMVTVKTVGRKWITLSNRLRIDINTLVADGGGYSSPGKCYLTKEEYEDFRRVSDKWKSVCSWLRDWRNTTKPEHIKESDIDMIINILGIGIE